MATASVVTTGGSLVGNAFTSILMSDDIQPGNDPSYTLCKLIFLYHPLGQKMADSPIKMAQSQERAVSVAGVAEDRIVKAFKAEWEAISADRHIRNLGRQSRIYGISSLAVLTEGEDLDSELQYDKLANGPSIAINIYDPLNTAGSLVLSQIPTDLDFQKVTGLTANGKKIHRSRFVVLMNEEPIYIAYTPSAFGYVGRSVYQRALYPLKSFLQTMITDDLVSVKAGVLVAMLKQAGSIVDNLMMKLFGAKRQIVKEARVGNVISIDVEEKIETLNFRNMDGPYQTSRENILKNIATAADMPAKLLENETFVEGFGEGTEDAKTIAKYIEGIRTWLQPTYSFFNQIVMYRAWNPAFIESVKKEFPALKNMDNKEIFYDWKNRFLATWPEVLDEPPSKQVKVDQAKMRAIMKLMDSLIDRLDPKNRTKLIEWAATNFNELEHLFPKAPLEFDYKILEAYEPPIQSGDSSKGGGGGDKEGGDLAEDEEDEDELEDRGEREEDYGDSNPVIRRQLNNKRNHKKSKVLDRSSAVSQQLLEDFSDIRDSMLSSAARTDSSNKLIGLIESMRKAPAPIINVTSPDVIVHGPPINIIMQSPSRSVKLHKNDDGSVAGVLEGDGGPRAVKFHKNEDGSIVGVLE